MARAIRRRLAAERGVAAFLLPRPAAESLARVAAETVNPLGLGIGGYFLAASTAAIKERAIATPMAV